MHLAVEALSRAHILDVGTSACETTLESNIIGFGEAESYLVSNNLELATAIDSSSWTEGRLQVGENAGADLCEQVQHREP